PRLFPAADGATEVMHIAGFRGFQPIVDWRDARGNTVKTVKVQGASFATGVVADDVWIVGTLEAKARFGTTTLTPRGEQDSFLARLDATGTWRSAALLGAFPPD